MYQLMKKRWGLTPDGLPVRLESYVADSDGDELPTGVPIGSDCVTSDGVKKLYFGGEIGWVTLLEGSGSGSSSSGAEIDDDATSSEKCWSSAKTSELLSGKADASGSCPNLVAGSAKMLTGGAATARRFTFESAGGETSIGSGAAQIKSVRGSTVKFAQVMQPYTFTAVSTDGVSIERQSDGSVAVSTSAGGATASVEQRVGTISRIAGHKYLIKGAPLGGSADGYHLSTGDFGFGMIYTAPASGALGIKIIVESGTEISSAVYFHPQAFDLTEMFGAGKEPSIKKFNAYFPEPVYAYSANASTLYFKGTQLKSVGFNAFDGTKARVIKSYDGAGENHGYELHGSYTAVKFARTADGTQQTLTPERYVTERGDAVTRILTPSAGYVFLEGAGADTCLNLIWSGNKSGANYTYEAYEEHSVNLPTATCFPDGMKEVGGVYDEITANAAIKRVNVVSMADLTWVASGGTSTTVFMSDSLRTGANAIAVPSSGAGNAVSSFADTVSSSSSVGLSISRSSETPGRLWLRTTNEYASVSDLVTALSGHTLRYELASPATTAFDEPLSLGIAVSDMGTEEMISASVGAYADLQIVYGLNVQDVLSRLDIDYISKESFDDFCTALSSALGLTVSSAYDAEEGKYTFTITSSGGQEG